MDILLDSGIQLILWIQSLGDWLSPIMEFITSLGNEQFYLIIAPMIIWCIDATLGVRLGMFLMINGMLNAALKIAFHEPRPYWNTTTVKTFGGAENTFGAPSGHAQNAVVVWGTLAYYIKKRWFWILAIFLIFMIGISRIYLAVHFPQDVLLGWFFGIVILWLLLRLEKPVVNWITKYPTVIQILITFLFSMFLILIVFIAHASSGGWTVPEDWVKNAQLAFPDEPNINPFSYHNFLSSTGAFFGLAAGWIWIISRGGFTTRDDWWKLILRYLLGIVGVLVLYIGLRYLFTDSESYVSYAARYFRYALIGFWMSGLAPWLFVKLKLASPLEQLNK